MTWLAQRLVIGRIPKQHHVALVRDDVIDHGGLGHPVLGIAQVAQRMSAQELPPVPLPSSTVPAARGALSATIPDPLVLLQVALVLSASRAMRNEVLASRVPAGFRCSARHGGCWPLQKGVGTPGGVGRPQGVVPVLAPCWGCWPFGRCCPRRVGRVGQVLAF